MPIQSGSHLGPYEVISAIGAGGMGEVWRAKDTRLDREVAIKVLPAIFAEDAQLRVRFDREAKAISSLNHPHICTLHDVGHENGTHFLVMELIDGESLADKLQRGPLPIEQVLRYGAQIATALDAAHRQGVIHRDLKPGNVMITKSGAKLLDFGLAKATNSAFGEHSVLPTQHKPITEQGMILGTFQYMSPEQLEGVDVDARSDIFALGTLLYEMATGRRAFQGASKTSLIAAIVSSQPAPISTIAPLTPPAFEHVVRKCLEKDPDERWQSAHDVASELRWISEAGSQAGVAAPTVASRRSRKAMLLSLAIIGWIAAIAAGAWIVRERLRTEPLLRPFRSDLALTDNDTLAFVGRLGGLAISPDGRRLVFPRSAGLLVHDFESGRQLPLDGTAEAMFPFWSPDGQWIGFFSNGKLRKIEATGGAVQTVCDARDGRGGTWSRNGTILFAPDIDGPLMKVQDAGGTPEPATRVPSSNWSHRNPHFLPDGERFLTTVRDHTRAAPGSFGLGSLGSLDVRPLATGSNPQYVDGRVFFVRDRNLIAQRLDVNKGALIGSPVALAQHVEFFNPKDLGHFSVSAAGVLAYRQQSRTLSQLTWIERGGGRVVGTLGEPGYYAAGTASASGSIACLIKRDDNEQDSVWVMDMKRGKVTRSTDTFSSGITRAVPSASGQQIAVSTWGDAAGQKSGAWIQSPSATGQQRVLLNLTNFMVEDWSRDGKTLMGSMQHGGRGFDVVWLTVDDPKKVNTFAGSPWNERAARLSPNGRWVAYLSDDGGTAETYVSDFPAGKNRWQVTRNNAVPMMWSRDGKELIVANRFRLTAYPIAETADGVEIGDPEVIRPGEDPEPLVGIDGDRLLVLKRVGETSIQPVRIIKNWQALLGER